MVAIGSRLDGLSVLVLEDEYLLADDVRRELVRAGAQVVGPFGAATDALAAIDRQKPDCALLDLNLGDGADFEPARALRARGVPFVFLSGYDTNFVPDDLRKVRFLQKPAPMKRIVDLVAAVCGR